MTPYRSSSHTRSSVSRVPANETKEKLMQSTNDFSVSEGGDFSSVALGTCIQHRAEIGSGLSETISSSSSDGVRGRGIGGRGPTVVSRDHVPAETKPRSRPASPEELGKWREGSVGSQSGRRLSGQNSGTGVRWDVGVSPRGGVDTAQEVSTPRVRNRVWDGLRNRIAFILIFFSCPLEITSKLWALCDVMNVKYSGFCL